MNLLISIFSRFAGVSPYLLIAATLLVLVLFFRLGGAYEYRAGYAAGRKASAAHSKAEAATTISRQLKDRLNAETSARRADSDGVCGPSVRDCPSP